MKAPTKEQLITILSSPYGQTGKHENRYLIYRMLQAMYLRQTANEQATGDTHVLNGVGFNGRDARFLSAVAQSSKQYNNLTVRQAAAVGKSLIKYSRQLLEIAEEKAGSQLALVAEEVALPVAKCGYCGTELPECDCYWKAEAAKFESQVEREIVMGEI